MIDCAALFSVATPTTCVTLLIATVLTIVLWRTFTKKSYNLPPGPPRKPLIGNMDLIAGHGMERIQGMIDLVRTYGSHGVATLHLANRKQIVITDYETIKRVCNDDMYTGRPKIYLIDKIFQRKGLLFTDGPLWREHRRFALTTLRDFGFGKTWLQDSIIEEAKQLIQDIESQQGRPINPTEFFTPCVANVICAIAYGKRFNHNDPQFRKLTSSVGENSRLAAKNIITGLFPFLRFIPFSSFRERSLELWKNMYSILDFMKTLIKEHQTTFHEGEAQDYVHAYMNESLKQKSDPNSTFTQDQLERSLFNLFGAGTDTTSTTLTWAVVYLLENPDVLVKLHKEIDQVVPNGGFANLEQKDQLPYLQATIMEVQRLANLVPVVPRTTTEEVELNGYTIPADTIVMPILYAVHMNPKYFPDPEKFNPNRFLDDSGKIKKVEGLMPFSIGKRFCLGESLAKMELYIFFANLVKYFTFSNIPGELVSSQESFLSVVHSPKPFKAILKPRVLN